MKEFTKFLKEESKRDISKIYQHNNSKEAKRTAEQNEQHKADKYNHYFAKWSKYLEQSETKAQKEYCADVLGRLQHIR